MVQVVAEHVNAAISTAVHQAGEWSIEVEDWIPGHQQPPYNHSTGQLSVSGEPRELHHWEIPGIINNHHQVIFQQLHTGENVNNNLKQTNIKRNEC